MNSQNIQNSGVQVPDEKALLQDLKNVLEVIKSACLSDNLREQEIELLLPILKGVYTLIKPQEGGPSLEREGALAKYFFGSFTAQLFKAVLDQRIVKSQKVTDTLYAILRMYIEMLVEEIPKDNLEFTENMRKIFESDSPFFNCHYNQVKSNDSMGLERQFWEESFQTALQQRDLSKIPLVQKIIAQEGKKEEDKTEATDNLSDENYDDDISSTKGVIDDDGSEEDIVSAIHKPSFVPDKTTATLNPYERALSGGYSFEMMANWFNCLEEGQLVDALKIEDNYKTRSWSRAKLLKSKKAGFMKLSFINDLSNNSRDFRVKDLATNVLSGEADIAPLGTRSGDFEWREGLKKDDLIDCFDTANVWYRSTILEERETTLQEGRVHQVHVAFRVYTENGIKTDADGRKYMGWHSKYDEWMNVHSPRIQKLGYMSKVWTEHSSAKAFNEDSKTVEDNEDVGLEFGIEEIDRKLIAVVRRNSLKSKIAVSLINYFGRLGGYERILHRIKDQENPTSFEQLSYFTELIGASHMLFHKRFTFNFIAQLRNSIPEQALAMMKIPKLIRELKKERLEKLLSAYENLLKRILVMEDRIYYCEKLSLDLHLIWIKSEFMSKRIFGLKHLEEYARNNRLYKRQAVEQDELINWIIKNNIVEEIFNPTRTHEELIKRSLEILKLFSSYSISSSTHHILSTPTRRKVQLNGQEIDPFEYVINPMWECAQSDPQFKHQIYKILNDASVSFNQEHNEYIIAKLAQIPVKNFTQKDIELINEMIRTSSRITEASRACGQRLWELATSREVPRDMRECATKNICELLKNYEWKKARISYIHDCVQLLKDRNAVNTALIILTKLLETLSSMKNYHSSSDSYTRYTMIETLDSEDQLTKSLFEELEAYYKVLISKANGMYMQDTSIIEEDETHKTCIEARLNFIKFVYQNTSLLRMEREQLEKMWELMMVQSPVANDRDRMFKLLKEAADHSLKTGESTTIGSQIQNEAILNIEDLVLLYREKLVPLGKSEPAPEGQKDLGIDLSFLREEGFYFLQILFVLVNEREGRLMKVEQKKYFQSTFFGSGSQYHQHAYSVSHVESKQETNDVYFKIMMHPKELEGLDIFWKIMLNSHDHDLALKAHSLLIRTFTSLSPELLEQIHELYREIIAECFKMLERIIKKDQQHSEREVIRILDLIVLIMKESEKKGVGSVRPHSGLLRERILTLKIHNNCTTTKQIPKTFLVRLYSNTTISEISSELSKILRTTAKDLKMTRSRYNSDIDEHDNAKTLNDLNFEENESLILSRRASYSTENAPLVNKNLELTPAAKKIFTEWFLEYADEVAQDGKKQMTMKGAAQFTSSCTHERCYENDDRIQTLFNQFDSNKDGRLDMEDFLEFYRTRANSHEFVVWNNLNYKGYGSDLTRDSDGGKSVKEEDLPRVFIVKDKEYFRLLFKVQQSPDTQISNAAWHLINLLATSQGLYESILNLDMKRDKDIGILEWGEVLSKENPAELLYTLQIIEFFIEEPPELGLATLVLQEDAKKAKLPENPEGRENEKSESGSEIELNDEVKQIGAQEDMYKTPPPKKQPKQDDLKPVSAIPPIEGSVKKGEEGGDQELPIWTYAGISANAEQKELIARKEWRLRFFQEGGFNYVFEMLMDDQFLKPERLLQTALSETKYVLKILSTLIRIVKTYLTAAFSASSESLHDVVNLVRRNSSQTYEEFQQHEKEEPHQSAEIIEFQELVSQLKGTAATELLMLVNFSKLQKQLLIILGTIVEGRKDMNFEERSIIESGLGLWVNCLLFKPIDLFKEFTSFGDKSKSSSSPLNSSQAFIIETLFTFKSRQVRRQFMKAFHNICINIPPNVELEVHPLIYFLRLLIANIPREYNIFRRECKDFYELLRLLIEEYYNKSALFMINAGCSVIDADNLIQQVLESFNDYEPKEKRGTYIQDQTLIGFLELLETIAKKSPEALNNQNGKALLYNTFNGCLFPPIFPSFEEDITESTDMSAPSLTPNKCQSKESREAAFKLLIALAQISLPMLQDLLGMIEVVVKKAPTQLGWGYSPSNKVKSSEGYVGIQNLGATCYMNAMLQQFYMIPSFRYSLLQIEDGLAPQIKEYKGRKEDDNVLHQLQKIFVSLELSEKRAYNPFGFCFAFKDYEGNPTNTAIQSDAQEFLNMAFERLEIITKKSHQKWLLPCIFGGRVCEQLTCKRCGYVRNNFQDYYNLSLEVKNIPSLYKSLDKFVAGETINDFMCEECKQKSEVRKRTCLAQLPNILIIHLQRIVFNFDSFVQEKVSSRFEFPKTLDLKPYTLDHVREQDFKAQEQRRKEKEQEEEKKVETKEEIEDEEEKRPDQDKGESEAAKKVEEEPEQVFHTIESDPCYDYKLVGVVLHQGPSAESGHYISYINTERGDPVAKKHKYPSYNFMATESEKWLEFNDSLVKHFPFSSLEAECFGSNSYSSSVFSDDNYYQSSGFSSDHDTRRCAYMLVYERAKKKDLKIQVSQEEAKAVEKAKADLQEQKKKAQSSALQRLRLEQKLEREPPLPQIIYNEESKEYEKLLNFYAVPRFIKKDAAIDIWNENNQFLFHQYFLYQQEFFDFVKSLATKGWEMVQAMLPGDISADNEFSRSQTERGIMQISGHTVMRLLSKSTNNNQIVELSDVLAQVLLQRGEIAKEFMKEFILFGQMSQGTASFAHQLFLLSPDRQVRKNVGKVITACVNSLFEFEKDYLQEEEIEITVEEKQNEKVEIQIRKPKALCIRYMNIVTEHIRKGDVVKNWLRFEEFFQFLADLAAGGELQRAYLMEHQYVALLLDMYLGQSSPLCPPNQKRETIGNSYAKPNFQGLFETITRLIQKVEDGSKLSEADKACLLDKNFFKKSIKESKEVAGCLVPLIVLQSKNNFDNSKHIARVLLRGVNDADFESISSILQILEPFILIEDQLQMQRLEWIYGVPMTSVRSSSISINYDYGGSSVSNTSNNSLPSMGISQNPSFVPDAHSYNSPLIKVSSSQSYLSVLFSKRARQETCAMQMMISIWQLVKKSELIRDYIFSMPPPNYDYGSYSDWWFRVATAYISETKRYRFSTTRSNTGVSAESLIDEIKELLANWRKKQLPSVPKQAQLETNIQNQYQNVFPRPYLCDYIIIRATQSVKVKEDVKQREESPSALKALKSSRKEVITLTVTRIMGEIITPTLPTGLRNFAVFQYQNMRGIYGSSGSTFLRGVASTASSIFSSSNKPPPANKKNKGRKGKNRNQKKDTTEHRDDFTRTSFSGGGRSATGEIQQLMDGEDAIAEEDFVINNDNNQADEEEAKPKANDSEDPPDYDLLPAEPNQEPEEDESDKPNPKEEEKKRKKVQKMPIRRTKEFKFESDKVDNPPLITISETPPQNVFEIAKHFEAHYSSSSESKEELEEEEQEEEKKIEAQVMSDVPVMIRVSVLNQTSETQKVSLTVRAAKGKAPNLWVPTSNFTCNIQDRHQRHILYLVIKDPKLYDAVEDEIVVEWTTEDHSEQIKVNKKLAKKEARNLSHLLYPPDIVKEEEAPADNDGTPSGGASGDQSGVPPKGMKNCRVCTFFIAESAKTCHVCESPQ